MTVAIRIQTIGLGNQRTGTDQQIAKPRPGTDTGVAVVGGIAGGQETALLVFTREKYPLVGHKNLVKNNHTGRLAIFGRKFCSALTGPAGRPGHNGDPRRIHGHGTGHSKVGIFRCMGTAGHDQKLMHVRGTGDNCLGATDHNPV